MVYSMSSIMSVSDTKISTGENSDNTAGFALRMGARKAAILLTMLGENMAQQLLSKFSNEESEQLLKTAATMEPATEEEAKEVLREFNSLARGRRLFVPAAKAFVRNVGVETLGSEQTEKILGIEPEKAPDETPMAAAEKASAEAIAMVLRKEHPQTSALALSALPSSKAAAIVAQLPEDQQPDVVKRMAELRVMPTELIAEIGNTLRMELKANAGKTQLIDGEDLVVNLLKKLSPEKEEMIFAALSEDNPELSESIRKKMFVFEDFITIDGRGIQLMLKEVDSRTLTLALKAASSPLREHLLGCMSSRAATMILEDLEALGPTSGGQVQAAQDDIVQIALRLAAEGKLNLR